MRKDNRGEPVSIESISLRPIQASDREFLFQLYAGTREEELAVVPWTAAQKEAFLRQQFDAQTRHYEMAFVDGRFDIIRAGSEDIGRLYVWRQPGELRIVDIALLPAWRGRGIGTALINDLLSEAAAGDQRVTIHVEKNNPALRLYLRLGFRERADNGAYWLMESKAGATANGTQTPPIL